jgi:hypothetical protein
MLATFSWNTSYPPLWHKGPSKHAWKGYQVTVDAFVIGLQARRLLALFHLQFHYAFVSWGY